jgi:hypothetical protein
MFPFVVPLLSLCFKTQESVPVPTQQTSDDYPQMQWLPAFHTSAPTLLQQKNQNGFQKVGPVASKVHNNHRSSGRSLEMQRCR